MLNGATYFVAGTNAYWLAQNSNADIDKGLDDIKNAGLTAVRTWGFNESVSYSRFVRPALIDKFFFSYQ